MEAEVAVEVRSPVIGGVHHNGSGSEVLPTTHAPPQGVNEQVAAELVALLRAVQCQAGEDHHRGWAPPWPGPEAPGRLASPPEDLMVEYRTGTMGL